MSKTISLKTRKPIQFINNSKNKCLRTKYLRSKLKCNILAKEVKILEKKLISQEERFIKKYFYYNKMIINLLDTVKYNSESDCIILRISDNIVIESKLPDCNKGFCYLCLEDESSIFSAQSCKHGVCIKCILDNRYTNSNHISNMLTKCFICKK